MKRLLSLLIAVLLLPALARAADFSVPAKVSQGHAFPVAVTASAPFEATFLWRGETLRVAAVEQAPSLWKAEALLAMPIDAKGNHKVRIEAEGRSREFSLSAVPVAWPKSILKVEPKYADCPRL